MAQQDVLGHADAVVCHGGSGSTLGAVAAGLAEPSYAERAGALAAELRAAPPVDEAVALFARSSHT